MARDFFDEDSVSSPKMKIAVIAGASEALKLKRDRKKSDDDIIQEITNKIEELIKNID